jgi:hypothetical protein
VGDLIILASGAPKTLALINNYDALDRITNNTPITIIIALIN